MGLGDRRAQREGDHQHRRAHRTGDSALLVADIPMGPRGAPFTKYGGAPFRVLEWAVTLLMLGVLVVKKVREPEGSLTLGG